MFRDELMKFRRARRSALCANDIFPQLGFHLSSDHQKRQRIIDCYGDVVPINEARLVRSMPEQLAVEDLIDRGLRPLDKRFLIATGENSVACGMLA